MNPTKHPIKADAITARTQGHLISLPHEAGMVIYNWMNQNGLGEDKDWYQDFYRRVVVENELFPYYLPTHLVLYWYVKALNHNLCTLPGNSPEDHVSSINEWFTNEVKVPSEGTYTYRELLFRQIQDGDDIIGIPFDSHFDFTPLIKKKAVQKKKQRQHKSQFKLL